MRTTLVIDDDVLLYAKGFSQQQQKTIGKVISDLARQALMQQQKPYADQRNGLPIIRGQVPVTLAHVNQLRDELE